MVLARAVDRTLAIQLVNKCASGEPAFERLRGTHRPDSNMVAVTPERDLIARFDAELVAEVLRDDDLPLGANLVSHTA